MTKRLWVLMVLMVSVIACGGGRAVTEKRMLEWAPSLNLYMGSNFEAGNCYPEALEEVPPDLSGELKFEDGWGHRFLYRRLRVDKYNIISAGPDGEFGNADDVILENGVLYDASKIYAENPLK